MSILSIAILFLTLSFSLDARRCQDPAPEWMANCPDCCLLTKSIQRPYIDEQIAQEKKLALQEEEVANSQNASTKCAFLLNRLFTEKRVWKGYITYVYLPQCTELPRDQLWQVIENLRDDGWSTELHEIKVAMSPIVEPLGYFYSTLGYPLFETKKTSTCRLDYHKDDFRVRSYCFLYYDLLHKKYHDGIVASKINALRGPSSWLGGPVCPESLELIGFDLRDLLFEHF